MTESILNKIIQNIQLRESIKSKKISNENIEKFINHLVTHIELPKCKRILKIFIKENLFSLDINQKHPNLPKYFNFVLDNHNTIVRLNDRIANFNSIDFEKIGNFKNNKGNIITPVSRKVYELEIIKDKNYLFLNL